MGRGKRASPSVSQGPTLSFKYIDLAACLLAARAYLRRPAHGRGLAARTPASFTLRLTHNDSGHLLQLHKEAEGLSGADNSSAAQQQLQPTSQPAVIQHGR